MLRELRNGQNTIYKSIYYYHDDDGDDETFKLSVPLAALYIFFKR